MTRVLVINPNCSDACSAGISAAPAPFRFDNGLAFNVVTLAEVPPAICPWRDWHAVTEPMCRLIERTAAEACVIASASDSIPSYHRKGRPSHALPMAGRPC